MGECGEIPRSPLTPEYKEEWSEKERNQERKVKVIKDSTRGGGVKGLECIGNIGEVA